MTPTVPEIFAPSPSDERPIVVSVPHSGTLIPEDERSWYRAEPDLLLRDGDLHVDRIYAGAEALGATVIRTPINRFVVDLNRLADDLSPRSVEGARRRNLPGYYGDRGLIWAVTTHGDDIYRKPLPRAVLERRLQRYYVPYHDALSHTLRRLRERFGYALLYDAHSMPSRASRLHRDPAGDIREDIVPGDLEGRSCAPAMLDLIVSHFRSCGLGVAPNRPYRGGGITRRHHDPAQGIHAIQVELRRDLYMDEATLEPHDGLETLRQHCLALIGALAHFDPRDE